MGTGEWRLLQLFRTRDKQVPTHLTADAAFDAWYVYEQAVHHGGMAAVPLNAHSLLNGSRDPDGVPRCRMGLRMVFLAALERTT